MPIRSVKLAQLPLRGSGGEPILFASTISSHGCAALAPATMADDFSWYRTTLRLGAAFGSGAETVAVSLSAEGEDLVISTRARFNAAQTRDIVAQVRRMFRLDDDLSPFYRAIENDPELRHAARGAGRLLASPTVFEDVVKTICTTNCAWSATVRMTNALASLGGGAFPWPGQLAQTDASWFTQVARMGYRGPYILALAREVVSGRLDLERLLPAHGLSDDEVEEALLALPGVGPYAAAHIMQLLGRHRRLILDSWTRPTYLTRSGKKRATDTTMRRAFARYGPYAGLAFWLYITRDWTPQSYPS